jgi:hypothetical protein
VFSTGDNWQRFEVDIVTQILAEKGHEIIKNVHLPDKRLDTVIE